MCEPAAYSLLRAGTCLNDGGAVAASSAGKSFARIAACGHTNTHLPHWLQRSGSQTGIASARLRFS
jgi:hypothetical protein